MSVSQVLALVLLLQIINFSSEYLISYPPAVPSQQFVHMVGRSIKPNLNVHYFQLNPFKITSFQKYTYNNLRKPFFSSFPIKPPYYLSHFLFIFHKLFRQSLRSQSQIKKVIYRQLHPRYSQHVFILLRCHNIIFIHSWHKIFPSVLFWSKLSLLIFHLTTYYNTHSNNNNFFLLSQNNIRVFRLPSFLHKICRYVSIYY